MNEKSLKGKIVKLYIKESGKHRIPIFVVKLDSGEVVEFGRGEVSVESFPKGFTALSSAEMEKITKQTFYGLKVGDVIYQSTQRNWD